MDFLKPLFFKKYRPRTTYNYEDKWEDHSIHITGKKLSVLIAHPNVETAGTVLLAHPMKHLGKQYFLEYGHAEAYLSCGYRVVLFDFNGFGESEDRGFAFPNDVFEVVQLIHREFPQTKLFLHGVSFGASQIINGIVENERLVDGLIIESAVSSNLAYYKGRGSRLYYLLNLYNNMFPRKNEHNIYTKVIQKLNTTPVLLIYGKQDVITPLWMGEKLFAAATTEKRLEVFDTKHLTTISEAPEKYRQVIKEFITEH